jgi:hypothetical protein
MTATDKKVALQTTQQSAEHCESNTSRNEETIERITNQKYLACMHFAFYRRGSLRIVQMQGVEVQTETENCALYPSLTLPTFKRGLKRFDLLTFLMSSTIQVHLYTRFYSPYIFLFTVRTCLCFHRDAICPVSFLTNK